MVSCWRRGCWLCVWCLTASNCYASSWLAPLFPPPSDCAFNDQLLTFRLMVVVLNCFQLGGALLYLTASSPIILIISRLVSGCGKCISVIFLVGLLDFFIFLYRYLFWFGIQPHTGGTGTYFWPLLEVPTGAVVRPSRDPFWASTPPLLASTAPFWAFKSSEFWL